MLKLTQSKIFFVTIVGLIILSGATLWREISKTVRIKNEVSRLERQAAELQAKNEQLKGLSDYLTSSAYLDRAARENLNLQLPGEVAVALPEVQGESTVAQNQSKPTGKLGNLQTWYNYFFGPKIVK